MFPEYVCAMKPFKPLLPVLSVAFLGLAHEGLGQTQYSHTLPVMSGTQISNWGSFTFPNAPATFGEGTLSFYWSACYNSGPGSNLTIEFRTGADSYVQVFYQGGNQNSCVSVTRTAQVGNTVMAAALAYGAGSIQGRARINYGCSAGMGCPFTSFAVLGNLKLQYTVQSASFSAQATAVCPGGTIHFSNASLGAPTSFAWSFPGGTPATSSAPDPTVQYALPGHYDVSLTITNAEGSSTALREGFITVHAPPDAFAGVDQEICVGGSAQLQASGGTTYQWLPATGLSNANVANPVATPQVPTTYTVIVVSAQGCEASDAMQLAVLPLPIVTAESSNPVLCAGDTLTITATGADLYTWSPALFLSLASGPSVQAWPPASFQWVLQGTTLQGCSDTTVVQVEVVDAPAAPTISAAGSALITPAQSGSYQWYLDGTAIPGATAQTWTPLANGTYTVQVVNDNGCARTGPPYFFASLGLSEVGAGPMPAVFPQPASDRLTVNNLRPGSKLTVVDASGRAVRQEHAKANAYNMEVGGLARGSYVLLIEHPSGRRSMQLLLADPQ